MLPCLNLLLVVGTAVTAAPTGQEGSVCQIILRGQRTPGAICAQPLACIPDRNLTSFFGFSSFPTNAVSTCIAPTTSAPDRYTDLGAACIPWPGALAYTPCRPQPGQTVICAAHPAVSSSSYKASNDIKIISTDAVLILRFCCHPIQYYVTVRQCCVDSSADGIANCSGDKDCCSDSCILPFGVCAYRAQTN